MSLVDVAPSNFESAVLAFFNHFDFDVRKTRDARFMDQKVTPDVLNFIANCIKNIPNVQNNEFNVSTIWDNQYFEKNVTLIYGKPSTLEPTASREYDKFIAQPLKALAYAKVLSLSKVGKVNVYKINNYELLCKIAENNLLAAHFLFMYICKVLVDSDLMDSFDDFKKKCNSRSGATNENLFILRQKFGAFIRGNTKIKGEKEIRRIFPKILNIYSFWNYLPGSIGGHISQIPINFSDISYNRKNFRDRNKKKNQSRQQNFFEHAEKKSLKSNLLDTEAETKKNLLEEHDSSEIHDEWWSDENLHLHHIFPKSTHPQLASQPENMIMLSLSQHLIKAHPKNNTGMVDRNYQLLCLKAKSVSIEQSLKNDRPIYSKRRFVQLINETCSTNLSEDDSFDKIRMTIHSLILRDFE